MPLISPLIPVPQKNAYLYKLIPDIQHQLLIFAKSYMKLNCFCQLCLS